LFYRKKKQDQNEFGQQALEYLDALYGTALRVTGSQAQAEDLVQDTFVRALRFWDKFDPGTNLRAWLFRMMFNLFFNQCRRTRRGREIHEGHEQADLVQKVLPDEHLAPTAKPEEFFFEKLFSDDVVHALDDLPSDFKMVVLLADIDSFSYKQISDILSIPVGTVMSRLHRGRRMLRHSLYAFALEEGYIKEDDSSTPMDLAAYRKHKKEAG
jgi:RNA polymerase sigma-70 factor (ECF subfamily)